MTQIGKNLNNLVTTLVLSQSDIGKVVGKGQTTISYWLKGKGCPDAEDLVKLSRFFDISMDDL